MNRIGTIGAVASSNPLAAEAGAEILRCGGNAVDAAIATVIAECVVSPASVGIGGYGGAMLVHQAKEDHTIAINFDSKAPLAATPDMFMVDAEHDGIEVGLPWTIGNTARLGYLSVSVPAVIAGLAAALAGYGTMSWADVSAPAIALAERGFRVSAGLAGLLSSFFSVTDNASRRALFPNGKVPSADDLFVQEDLARFLRKLADEGPDSFYGPEIAGKIVKQVSEGGGILELEDFETYEPVLSEPLSIDCGRYRLLTPGLPAGGLTSLQITKALHALHPTLDDYSSGKYHHLLAEVMKFAWQDRLERAGDPLFVEDPTEELLSDAHTEAILSQVRDRLPGDAPTSTLAPESHTIHLVTADSNRNMVSLTATHGGSLGSNTAIEGLGMVLGHGMSRFTALSCKANSIAPGKRMLHNMSPMILLKDGKINSAFGLPGGRRIVNVAAQLAVDFIEFGHQPAQAIAAPRIHTEGFEPLLVESAAPAELIEHLMSRGHKVEHIEGRIGGATSAIAVDDDGLLQAVSQMGENSVVVV